jgi:hypothetical protein
MRVCTEFIRLRMGRVLVNTVINLLVSNKEGNFLTN